MVTVGHLVLHPSDMVYGAVTLSPKEWRCHGVFLLCFAEQKVLDNLVAYLGTASELTSDFPGSHASRSQYQH